MQNPCHLSYESHLRKPFKLGEPFLPTQGWVKKGAWIWGSVSGRPLGSHFKPHSNLALVKALQYVNSASLNYISKN